MATTSEKAVIEITAKDKASATLKTVRGSVNETGVAVAKLGAIAVAAGAAFAAVAAKAIDASNKQETGVRKLDAALQRTGSSYLEAAAEIEEFAKQQQATTRFGDDETRKVLTQLVQLTGTYGAETKRAAGLIQDMAESGQSLEGATRAVGMALAGNVQSLGRYVPELRGLKQAELDAMTAAERQRLVLDALEKQYGGTAKAIAPLEQQLANISNTLGDVFEAFGDALKKSAALEEGVGLVLGSLQDLEAWIKTNSSTIGDQLAVGLAPGIDILRALAVAAKIAIQTLAALPVASAYAEKAMMGWHMGYVLITEGNNEHLQELLRLRKKLEVEHSGVIDDQIKIIEGIEKGWGGVDDLLAGVQARMLAVASADAGRQWWMPDAPKTPKTRASTRGGASAKTQADPSVAAYEDSLSRLEAANASFSESMSVMKTDFINDINETATAGVEELGVAAEDPYQTFLEHMEFVRDKTKEINDSIAAEFASLGQSIASAAIDSVDAWVSGTSRYDNAMAAFVAITLRAIGRQAAMLALFEAAKGWAALATPYTAPLAPLHFTAAAKFAAIGAVGIAAGGLATRGGATSTSGSGSSSGSSSSSDSGSSRLYTGAQSSASAQEGGPTTLIIHQHIGGSLIRDREAGAYVARALQAASASGMTTGSARNG